MSVDIPLPETGLSSLGIEEDMTSVWVPDNAEVWCLRDVMEVDPSGAPVVLSKGGEQVALRPEEYHPFDPSHGLDLDDISRLNNLHEAPLLHCLKRRFKDNNIYTWVGHVLLSVNPYRVFPTLYNLEDAIESSKFEDVDDAFDVPHVYSIAKVAHGEMSSERKHSGREDAHNQSIVVSGESGAGKTEASKHVMRYLLASSATTDKALGEPSPGSLSIEIALWLAENGRAWLNQVDIDGNSALHLAVSNNYVDLAAALVRKGADMSLKNAQGKTVLDLISSTRDVERICMVGNIGASSRKPLLGAPKSKVRGCTYLTMLVEKITLQGARSLDCPYVRMSVYNKDRELVEEVQDVSKFSHRNDTCLWYTTQYHMQVPLENTTDSFILLELVDESVKSRSKVVTETICWTFLRLKDGSVDTSTHSLECYAPPVKLGLGENVRRERDELFVANNGGFFSVDTYLTTRGSSKRG